MGTFHSTAIFQSDHSAMSIMADAIALDFQKSGYKVKKDSTVTGGYVVSITKGNIFSAVLGLQTALKVTIKPTNTGISVDAGVGLFGLQVIPTIITFYLAFPVIITQVWGLIRQAGLDDRVIEIAREIAKKNPVRKSYCPHCGKQVPSTAIVCPQCHHDLSYLCAS